MKKLAIIACLGLSIGAQAQTVFYGGDWDGASALVAEINSIFPESYYNSVVYDDFTVTTETRIDGVFGNFFTIGNPTLSHTLYWEIRKGITPHDGGTVVHDGTVSNATVTSNGDIIDGSNPGYLYDSDVDSFVLEPGTYFLGLAVDHPTSWYFVATTSGDNGIGSPLANGNSFWTSAENGAFFNSVGTDFDGRYDFSMGLRGSPVPEPASFAALGLGILSLGRRRKKKH
ncbi:MAG: PEP-CTERM sorting domain-containing protein [Armatimonadetes bacterium]|nr:PEP-CTERM sorting domain-containing protein [Armatimonadota bacterium]